MNYDVINVDVGEFEAVSQEVIHRALESTWCIAQAKGHHLELVRSELCLECCTLYVVRMYADLVIALR